MNKTIKVLLADTSDFFGVPCAAALRSHEMDVIQVEKGWPKAAGAHRGGEAGRCGTGFLYGGVGCRRRDRSD